ncbi:MAG: prepilin peptidase [Gammaproteobacteria bacterium]|nr:prepilin peptidase [Gammaproteobacteria bacterium]
MNLADTFGLNPALFAGVAGLFGLLIGSFLNVVIYRLPIMLEREWKHAAWMLLWGSDPTAARTEPFNLMVPRSACPSCGAQITASQNIPIVSWLALRGACAGCGTRIPARYPIIELLTGALTAAVAWHFGFTLDCGGALLLTWSLIALAVIDFDTQLLPDIVTLPLLWLGLAFSLIHPDSAVFAGPQSAIIGGLAGYLSLWSVYQGFKLATGKEGMGYGDFKLLAALGAWLGWQMLLLIVVLSAGIGLVAAVSMMVFRGHDRQIPIPFGPYLAAAGFIAMIWGRGLMDAYLGLSGLR